MRRPESRGLALIVVLAAALAPAAPARAATCEGADVVPTQESIPAAQVATVCLVNERRAQAGLAKLTSVGVIRDVATGHSRDMVARHYFEHTSPDGKTLAQRLVAYTSPATEFSIAENLAWGEGELSTPRAIVEGWMKSPPHRANILLSAIRDIGIGIAVGSPQGSQLTASTYTANFGRRKLKPKPCQKRTTTRRARSRAAAKRCVRRAPAKRR